MISFLLIIENEKEGHILKQAFEQYDIKIVMSKPTFANYIQAVQTKPNIVIIELPRDCNPQKKFVGMLKENNQAKKIPVLGYGNHNKQSTIKTILQDGFNAYMIRPLKFIPLTESIQKLIPVKQDIFKHKAEKQASDREDDIKYLLDLSKPPMEKIDLVVGYVKKMLAFPFTVAKVLNVTSDENSGAGALAKAIEADPVISATILKVSNTVIFASRDKEITSVKDAIIRIGFMETRNIALSLSVMKLFDNDKTNFGFSRIDFWYHSLATGLLAERLAKNTGFPITGEAFLTGLLHDFGVILLDEFFSDVFQTVMEKTTENGSCFVDEVVNTIGISHNDIVEQLFENWKLPGSIGFAIKNHNNFQGEIPASTPDNKALTQVVGMANMLTKTYILGTECDRFIRPIDDIHVKKIKLPLGITPAILNSIHDQLNVYNKFLKLDEGRSFPLTELEIENAPVTKLMYLNRPERMLPMVEGYLKTQQYKLSVQKGEEIPEKFDVPEVAIIDATNSDTNESIEAIITALNNNEAKLPVSFVLLYPPESELKDFPVREGIEKLPQELDLRSIDEAISKAKGDELSSEAIAKEMEKDKKEGEEEEDILDELDKNKIGEEDLTSDIAKLTDD